MSKSAESSARQSRLILEELEERRLFSGGIEGLIELGDNEADALYRDFDSADRPADAEAGEAEQRSREIVFVDAGVDDYQQLVTDLELNTHSSRDIEVVVLERDRDGIETISAVLQDRQGLDAIHIIAHGADASLELGNSRLDTVAYGPGEVVPGNEFYDYEAKYHSEASKVSEQAASPLDKLVRHGGAFLDAYVRTVGSVAVLAWFYRYLVLSRGE